MDQHIQSLLQKDNPWLSDPDSLPGWLAGHLPHEYIARLQLSEQRARWSQADKAHLVVGPRQAGKSTSIWQWLSARGAPVLFVDCEQPLLRSWCRNAAIVAADLAEAFAEPPFLFFEEIQHLNEAALFIKGLVDRRPGAPVLVTGSSSYALQSRTRESLAGRATRARLLPLSFLEVSAGLEDLAPLVRDAKRDELFSRHLVFGGYPEVWLSPNPELVLTDLLESFLIRDASDLLSIKRPDAFRTLLSLSAKQAGSLVNISEWAQILNLSRDSVYSYLEILQSAHVLQLVRPFVGGKRSELTRRPKVFWLDTGLRNRLLADFRPPEQRQDLGALMECWVLTEIVKHLPALAEVHFWRNTSGAEVDFVIRHGQRLLALEVKAGGPPGPRLARSTRSFIDAYHPDRLGVIRPGASASRGISGTSVDWLPPTDTTVWLERHLQA